ncbi:MAG: hypothetical protein ABIR15_23470 [Chitinophagaceae bacterium]
MNTMKFMIVSAIVLLTSLIGTAQVSADSISSLKQQKQSLELSNKINEHKMKLAKLENTLDKKTREMESTAEDARKAAEENAEAASRLNGDPQDKALARRSENAGDGARKNAKRARAAANSLADLKKDIESLRNKIAEEETKLAINPVAIPVQQ